MESWFGYLADWAATKHGMNDALTRIMTTGRLTPGETRSEVTAVVADLFGAGVTAGALRPGTDPGDVVAVLVGLLVAPHDQLWIRIKVQP